MENKMKIKNTTELHTWLSNMLLQKYITKADLKEVIDNFNWDKSIPMDAVVKVNFADLADEVKQDIENRIVKGVQTYGERLRINNGRNALLDAYEEILDLALYIKQELKEKESKISA